MTMNVPIGRFAAAMIYLLAITGAGVLVMKLTSVLATQAIALSQPYLLDHCPCLPSLVEQRRIAAQIAAPLTAESNERVAALEAPSIPAGILAAQMDLAEQQEKVVQSRVPH